MTRRRQLLARTTTSLVALLGLGTACGSSVEETTGTSGSARTAASPRLVDAFLDVRSILDEGERADLRRDLLALVARPVLQGLGRAA